MSNMHGIANTFLGEFDIAQQVRSILLLSKNDYRTRYSFLDLLAQGRASSKEVHQHREEIKQGWSAPLTAPATNAVTAFTVGTVNVNKFSPNDVIQIGDEQMIVQSIDKGAGTIAVKGRGQANTVAAAHASGAVVQIIGNATPEGEVNRNFNLSQRRKITNEFQEFTHTIELTERSINIDYEDRERLWFEEVQRVLWRHMLELDNTLLNGHGYHDDAAGQHTLKGTKQLVSEYGGITQTSVGYTNGAFDKNAYIKLMHMLMERGSDVVRIVCNAGTKTKFTQLLSASYVINEGAGIRKAVVGEHYDGMVATERDGRIFTFQLNDHMKYGEALFVPTTGMTVIPRLYRVDGSNTPFLFKKFKAKENTARKVEELKSEVSLEIKRPDTFAYLTNLFA